MATLWILSCLALAATSTALAGNSKPTNVLFMLIDDLGYADVGYHGNKVGASIPTPTIDELSGQGVRLEGYYVVQLCSPTRTSLMSGRYPYTIGMNAEVIVDGHPSCLPLNASTIADRLLAGGWATSAYGKWDLGMTTWGCTPTCRGFEHFYGFYNAFNDYFTHHVGVGLDFRNDTTPVKDLNGSYFTELVTADAIRWTTHSVKENASRPTFAYLAHQSNHAPLEVPMRYIQRPGCSSIPAVNPSRKMLCGMMAAVDDSLKNMTEAYKALGIWENTVIVFSTDNGGNTDTGGNNFPLRGNKATTFEGGIRGVGWVGGGWTGIQRGVVSNAMIHVSDWYPTIVSGIAGLPVNIPADGHPALDGISAWDAITTGANSSRTEMLLNLISTGSSTTIPGQGAIRMGPWKLLYGHTCVWGQKTPTLGCGSCVSRDQQVHNGPLWEQPLPVTPATSPPFCPNGWVPPPESGKNPLPPPGVDCPSLPCEFTNSTLITGGVFLYNIELDPTEFYNRANEYPDIVHKLYTRLQEFNATNIPQDNSPMDPKSSPSFFGDVWTPWQGDPNPANCARPTPPVPQPEGDCDGLTIAQSCFVKGWASGPKFSGAPLTVRVTIVDGNLQQNTTANEPRKIAGDHGFTVTLDCSKLKTGAQQITVEAFYPPTNVWFPLLHSPICTLNGKVHRCPPPQPSL